MLLHGRKGYIPTTPKLWVIIGGESNSGGLAFNSDLDPGLLTPSNRVLIWDNIGNATWQQLSIGVNNLLGHTDLSTPALGLFNTRHGLEAALLSRANKQMYLTKTGQGGSRIAQWLPSDASGYYNTLQSRINAGISALNAVPHSRVYVWWQGVNDANDGNTSNQWVMDTAAHFTRVRALLGANTPIIALTIMPNTPNKVQMNINIRALAVASPGTHVVDVSAANNYVQSDTNHWDATGFNIAGNLVVNKINTVLGLRTPFTSF